LPRRAVVVCPSVCPSYADIVSKLLNIRSRKQRHTIAHGLYLSDAKNVGVIPTVFLLGRQIEVGLGSDQRFSTYVSLYLKNGAR